jgi:hypothetical protein
MAQVTLFPQGADTAFLPSQTHVPQTTLPTTPTRDGREAVCMERAGTVALESTTVVPRCRGDMSIIWLTKLLIFCILFVL